jgi:hypothetical protein
MKLKGQVKKKNVTILTDTWNTHNFIDINVAIRLNLFVYPAADIRAMVAYGEKLMESESVTRSTYKYKIMNWNPGSTEYPWEE